MMEILFWIEFCLRSLFEDHSELVLENLALRQQLAILKRQWPRRPQLKPSDRLFWVFLSRWWPAWKDSLLFVQPQTVIGWHRKGFQFYWRFLSRRKTPGRPKVDKEIRQLIHQMSQANPLWGAPRVHGELLKLGFEVSERTVSRLMPRKPHKPSSQTWRAFLANHSKELVSIDFLVVPTATFRLLYVLVILSHQRRRVVHFNVTAHLTAAWTAQQLVEAFPEDTAPRFLLRDRDAIYGQTLTDRVYGLGNRRNLNGPAKSMAESIRREISRQSAPGVFEPRHHLQ